eukprot:c10103_g1_i1.p1 GENE.c10103_g1_i1~~c10103_g1_i1.p1  ORF type:complete len:281 (-),score=54.50 c10103_g1_i1:25-867(-)
MSSARAIVASWEQSVFSFFSEGGKYQLDPITGQWPFASLLDVVLVVAVYLAFIVVGVLFQRSSLGRVVVLQKVRLLYNFAQVVLCSYMCVETGVIAWRNGYTFSRCNDDTDRKFAEVFWLFYVSKIFDFADTLFIILGRKWDQLSALHIYHHSSMFAWCWVVNRFWVSGGVFNVIVANGFVHVVMYLYYFLSLHTKDIWWKRFLTQFQIVQFLFLMTQVAIWLWRACPGAPPRVVAGCGVYAFSILVLFVLFYLDTYSKKKASKSPSAKSHDQKAKAKAN